MKIFVSWSGETSHAVAQAFRELIPRMFHGVRLFLSSADIDKGARWSAELDRELDATHFGLICLTPDNLRAPFLMYEAGALAKSVDQGRVATVLFDVTPAGVDYPLARFQATELNRDDIFLLMVSINRQLGDSAFLDADLASAFELWWPLFEDRLESIHELTGSAGDIGREMRSDRELLEEVLGSVRQLVSAVDASHQLDRLAQTATDAGQSPILRRTPGVSRD